MAWLATFLLALASSQLPVRVWEESVVFPTYPLGAEDVNPHFYELEGAIIYPYTMQDAFTTEKVDRVYRGWHLENEYVKLLCLPDIGGRIQYVLDKRRNEPMFYFNRVIRPGHIALRGAWVSGGIEWNRGPQGHTVTSFSPVDVLGVENADGSASLLIGNVEKNFRTGWQVRLTLHPGRTYLDEEIVLYNPTDGIHPYYFWNNTAFPNRPGTRFVFPMTLGTDHDGKSFFTWPIHEGRDLTWLRNYEEPTSIFAYRSVFDFFGAYDAERDYGIVQVSDHRRLPGKKAWTWGQADSGLVSQSVLTDEDGPYIEVQSGPLPTQADFAPLAPGAEIRWQEFWVPVFGLGEGYEYATRDVTISRIDREDDVELRFHASSDLGTVELRAGDETHDLRLHPGSTASVVLEGRRGAALEISLRGEDGKAILSYRSPLSIPVERPPSIRGPRTSRWDETYENLTSEDGFGLYSKAVAALGRGDLDGALHYGVESSAFDETRSLGLGVSGRALMRMDRIEEALERFRSAFRPEGRDRFRLFDQMLIASLAAGEVEVAKREARAAIDEGTLRLVPRAVLALSGETSFTDFAREARHYVGEDEFAFIELSLAFVDLGRFDEAIRLLDAARSEDWLLSAYYLAYWSHRTSNDVASRGFLAETSTMSSDYAFPSRPEALEVLTFAARETGDGKAFLLLGNLLAGLGRIDEAVVEWKKAAERDRSLSVAHRNLAMAAWRGDGDLEDAAQSLRRAIHARPSDQTLYRDLARVRLEQGLVGEAIAVLDSMRAEGGRRADVVLLLARALVKAERFGDAIALLEATTFSNREGDSDTWQLHSDAHTGRGTRLLEASRLEEALRDFESALTYPRNLNVGRPARPREAKALYFKALSLEQLGRGGEARETYRLCTLGAPLDEAQSEYIERCREALK
jgi:tetratricopeptide (TPR) repeat protein